MASIELAELSATTSRAASTIQSSRQGAFEDRESSPDNAVSALPPVDRGKGAWAFLAAATMCEVCVWGPPFSVGILHQYWTTTLFPEGTPGRELLTLAATLQTGLLYLGAAFWGALFRRFPHYRVHLQAFGIAGGALGTLGAAFATKPWHLVLTFGLIYPLSALFYLPAATLLFEWFQARRGLASGVMFAGTGVGGTIFPFAIQALISRFGYRAALVSVAVCFALFGGVSLVWIRPRIPVPKDSNERARARRIDAGFLKMSTFYAFVGSTLFSSLGNFIPSVWIPSYATDIGLSENDGTVLISAMNAASVPGLLIVGYLSDIWPLRAVVTLSCGGSAISCLLLWGFSQNIGSLTAFAIVFGLLGLSFSALWTRLISIIALDDPSLPPLLFSVFAFARGVGNISSGPVANALLESDLFAGSKGAYGVKNYGSLLLYSGLTMAAGSVIGVLYRTPPSLKKSKN
ncbi:putative monocarboxylic acid transporter [Leucosporidium creatinivorum]|uniref:Putative monocarboxylic acid transporter n=1 Tax=Leucosporidium creatinivorum TaxID=106004 RepID=A0A1Y2ESK9_9BASI|nr:putative monocarboxylic acid transporter [Leucosporidium creatinivorum]